MGNIKTLFANFTEIIKTKKKWIIPIAGMTVGGVILAVYLLGRPGKDEAALLSREREYIVTRGNITVGVEGSGKLEAKRTPQTFASDLIFEKYNVNAGDMVKKGDAIAEISKEGVLKVIEELQSEADNAYAALQEAINAKTLQTLQTEKEQKERSSASQNAYESSYRQYSDQASSLEEKLTELNAPDITPEEARLNADNAAAALEAAERDLAAANSDLEAAVAAKNQYTGDDPQQLNALQAEVDKARTEVSRLQGIRDEAAAASGEAARIREAVESAKGIREQLNEVIKSMEALNSAREKEIQTEQESANLQGQVNSVQLKSLQAAIDKAQSLYDTVKKKLDQTKALLEEPVLYAEMDGVILAAPYLKGEKIVPDKAVAEIGDLTKMLLRAEIEPADINEVEAGQDVRVVAEIFPNQEVKGKVISKTLTPNEGMYSASIELEPNELGLLEGMAASATIISKEKENVLILSNKAITLKGGKQYVNLRIEDKNAKKNESGAYTLKEIEITTGFSDGRMTEVLSGLSENDVVIVKE